MIPIAEFSKRENLSEEKTITLIREGVYSGRIVDGMWFVEATESTQSESDGGIAIQKLIGPFLKGCSVGLIISLFFGLLTYPWEIPNFEGAAGYHMLMMIYVTPVLTLGTGIIYKLYKILTNNSR